MSIRWDTRNKAWRFEFDRRIQGRRERASKLLPKGWSQAQADAYDRTESARLYAVATGVQQDDPLIEHAVALYLQDKTALKSYKKAAENLAAIVWAYVGKPMSALPQVAREVATHTAGAREGVTLQPATIKQRLALLKAACRWAWKAHGLTQHDPTARMQLPTVRNARQVYLGRREMLQVARAAKRHDVRVLIRTAFYTGMRKGELRRVQVDGDVLWLADTKNGAPRAVPVHPRIRTCLPYLPLTTPATTLDKGWQQARAAVGMEHVHLHDLRHSTASEMINAGVDLFTVGQVLGHKDQRSTARYSHLRAQVLAAAVGMVGRKLPHTPHTPAKKKAA